MNWNAYGLKLDNEVYDCEGTQMKTDALYRVLNTGIDLYLPTKTVKIHQTD